MTEDFEALRHSPPDKYNWQKITEFDELDKRAFLIDEFCGSQIGILEADLKWRPANLPPSDDEVLGWLWVIRPDLEEQVLAEASDTLQRVIGAFRRRDGVSPET